jgi:IS30 family transposase
MRNYNQLTQTERYQIYALRKANKNPTEISRVLGRHKSTIYRELKRNLGKRGYRAVQAHQFAVERHMSRDRRRISLEDWQLIESLIRRDWSPEQISLWLKKYKKIRISHEWIYQYIFKDKSKAGDLHTHLRSRKKRKKRYGSQNRRGMILNRVSIEKRPAVVDQRSRIGDWEIDTIIGAHHQGVLLSLVERKSRLCLIARLANKSAQEVERTTINLLDSIKEKVHTVTSDNGKEFAKHESIAKNLDAQFFFAHPYASWERGLNENTNGLIRQYFPKKTQFNHISDQQVQSVMEKLNNRPRKCLGMKTPNQVFFKDCSFVALRS